MTISQQPQASDVDDVDFPLPPTRKRKEIRLSDKGGQQPRASKNQLSSARSTTSFPSTIATFTETPPLHRYILSKRNPVGLKNRSTTHTQI